MLTPHLLAWLAVTIGHLLLTRRWVAALGRTRQSRDDGWFDTALAAAGSLAIAVHLAAVTGGLTVATGAAALALWHLAVASALHVSRRPRPPAAAQRPDGATEAFEFLAGVLLAGVSLAWIGTAIDGPLVTGADAAHYHVPVAVNLALGASPLDLPATQHLYPMTMSSLMAWCILATGDLLVVDLAMLAPVLLLAASVALLFRLVTNASGLAWTTVPVLALFATPMFRASALPSADLLFAAAFTASLAQLLRMWSRGASAWDVVLLGLALGLLVGSKATGIPAAVLLFLAWAVLAVATRSARASFGAPEAWPVAAGVAMLAGGVWLVRNWMLFGSPIAPNGLTVFGIAVFPGEPFAPTTYLSVLGDATADVAYPVAARVWTYAERWFGVWFLPWLAAWLLLLPDAALAWRAPSRRALAAARLAAVWLVVASGGPLLWLLAGAPWTSLEWTDGYALRYALPLAVVLPALSLAVLLPASSHWHRHRIVIFLVMSGVTVAGLAVLARAQAADADSPRLSWPAIAAALGLLVAARGAAARRAWQPMRLGRMLVVAVTAAAVLTPFIAVRREVFAGTPVAAPANPAAASALGAVERWEAEAGLSCDARRFFTLTRFDAPLAVQSSGRPDAQVFYAAREVDAARRFGPLYGCDYVITTAAVESTLKGAALVEALLGDGRAVTVPADGTYVVLTARPAASAGPRAGEGS